MYASECDRFLLVKGLGYVGIGNTEFVRRHTAGFRGFKTAKSLRAKSEEGRSLSTVPPA
jgi:hypothetical protein